MTRQQALNTAIHAVCFDSVCLHVMCVSLSLSVQTCPTVCQRAIFTHPIKLIPCRQKQSKFIRHIKNDGFKKFECSSRILVGFVCCTLVSSHTPNTSKSGKLETQHQPLVLNICACVCMLVCLCSSCIALVSCSSVCQKSHRDKSHTLGEESKGQIQSRYVS